VEVGGGSLLSEGRYFRDLLAATISWSYFREVAAFGWSLFSEMYGIFDWGPNIKLVKDERNSLLNYALFAETLLEAVPWSYVLIQ